MTKKEAEPHSDPGNPKEGVAESQLESLRAKSFDRERE